MRRVHVMVLLAAILLFAVSAMLATDDKESASVEGDPGQVANASKASGEEIGWQVISSGGDINGTSTNFGLSGTVGQTAIGLGGSDNFRLSHGFWQEFAESGMCGDANGDETINIADAVYIIDYVFRGGPPPDPLCVGDANGDGSVNVADAVHLINYIFKGGPAPVEDCCP